MRNEPNFIALRREAPAGIRLPHDMPSRPGVFFWVGALALLLSNAVPIALCANDPEKLKIPVLVYGLALLFVGAAGSGFGGHVGAMVVLLIAWFTHWYAWRWYFVVMLSGLTCLLGVFLVLNRV